MMTMIMMMVMMTMMTTISIKDINRRLCTITRLPRRALSLTPECRSLKNLRWGTHVHRATTQTNYQSFSSNFPSCYIEESLIMFMKVERMTKPELKQVLMEAEELPKVMKQVDEIDIRKMTKETLKEVVEDIMEDHEDDLEDMTKVELKEIVMEAVAMSPAEKPKVLQHVDEDDVGKMTKETLQKVAEEVIENKLESIEEMTKQELKEIVMEVAVEKEELIIVPVAEEDIEQMNLKELKEFVKEASDLAAVEKPKEEVTEEDVAKVGFNNMFYKWQIPQRFAFQSLDSNLFRCPWRS